MTKEEKRCVRILLCIFGMIVFAEGIFTTIGGAVFAACSIGMLSFGIAQWMDRP